jgi:hypothetical protein
VTISFYSIRGKFKMKQINWLKLFVFCYNLRNSCQLKPIVNNYKTSGCLFHSQSVQPLGFVKKVCRRQDICKHFEILYNFGCFRQSNTAMDQMDKCCRLCLLITANYSNILDNETIKFKINKHLRVNVSKKMYIFHIICYKLFHL